MIVAHRFVIDIDKIMVISKAMSLKLSRQIFIPSITTSGINSKDNRGGELMFWIWHCDCIASSGPNDPRSALVGITILSIGPISDYGRYKGQVPILTDWLQLHKSTIFTSFSRISILSTQLTDYSSRNFLKLSDQITAHMYHKKRHPLLSALDVPTFVIIHTSNHVPSLSLRCPRPATGTDE